MKAMLLRGAKLPFEPVELPDPAPGAGEAVARVITCGSGLTIQHAKAGRRAIPFPRVIGHEITAEIVAIGAGVTGLKLGDAVTAYFYLNCGHCRWCRTGSMAQFDQVAFLGTSWTGGALAERLNLNAYQCYHLSPAISDEIGALVEPFSSTVRAVAQGEPVAEDRVAIVGAGPIGLMALMAARLRGVKQVVAIEMAERRIEAAKLCGADEVINPQREDPEKRARELTQGQGFDMVMECAGQPASVLMAAKLTRTRGRLVIMGVFEKPAAIDLTDVVFREKIISGSMSGYGLYDETIRIMTDPRFRGDLLITDHIGLDDLVGQGYHGLLHEKDKHVKILVRPE